MSTTEVSASRTDLIRTQAVEVTRSLLAAHGLSLTMDQIADGSGISRRSLFRYFASRDALVQAAIESALVEYEAQLASVAAVDGQLEDWLTRIIEHTHRSHLAAGRAIWQLTSSSVDQLAPELRAVNEHRRTMRRRATRQLTDQAWSAAGGTGNAPDVVAEALALAMSSYTTQSLIVDLGQSIEDVARLSAEVILTVIDANRRS